MSVRTLPKAVLATSGVPSVTTALVAKLTSPPRFVSTAGVTRRDDELNKDTFSDAFDESDKLEEGKKEESNVGKDKNMTTTKPTNLFASHFHDFDNFFAPFAKKPLFAPLVLRHGDPWTSVMPVLRRFPRDSKQTILRSSPGYEIRKSDGIYQIAVDVPEGLTASDLKVEVENNGTFLHISGQHETEQDGMKCVTQFSKRFALGQDMNMDELTANFTDGMLTLMIPEPDETEEHGSAWDKKEIPITQKHRIPSDEEILQKDYSDAFDDSDWTEAGKSGKVDP
jgi:HSP20 family molecular chaperone IbpA